MRKRVASVMLLTVCLVVTGVITASGAESPIDKGSYLVGGMAMLSSMSGDLYDNASGDKPMMLMLAPSLGGFVIPHLAIGGQLLIANFAQGGKSLTVSGIGPRVGYYFGNAKEQKKVRGKSYPYVAGSYIYGKLTNDWGGSSTSDVELNAMIFSGGVNYMLTNSIGLVAEVNFRSDSVKDGRGDSESGTSFNVVAGFSMFVW